MFGPTEALFLEKERAAEILALLKLSTDPYMPSQFKYWEIFLHKKGRHSFAKEVKRSDGLWRLIYGYKWQRGFNLIEGQQKRSWTFQSK